MATATPAAPKSTTPAAKGEEKYATMIVGIGKTHEADHTALCALADSLQVKVGHLVWFAIAQMQKTPPKSASELGIPVSVRSGVAGVGAAPGFWIVPVNGADGKPTGVKVVEVAKRGDAAGREFYRFTVDKDDVKATAKNRDRARAQALRGAKSDLAFLGVKGEVKVTDLVPAAK